MFTGGDYSNPEKRSSTIRDDTSPLPLDLPERLDETKNQTFFRTYRILKQFPATGGEADIWLVEWDKNYYVLKQYRLGIEPKLEVLDQVSQISLRNPKNLIKIIEYGFDDESERWFEILEYAKYGSLRDLVSKQTVNSSTFKTIIEEIAFGLDTLHKNNILHLDLKPSNILIREARPLNLILTDFGISTLLDGELSRHITSTKGTPMYWAPEQLGNVVGREADYWAVGVIALEIIQKKHPFEGLNHNYILSTLASRGIILSNQINADVLILLKGLLTRNPKKRWGKREVSLWLSGKRNIPVYYEEEQSGRSSISKPYEFHDEQYYNLNDLVYAFISDPVSWEDAKRHIGRGYLLRWLEMTEQYNKAVTISKYVESYPNDDERLLYIASELNKDIPFTLFGKRVDLSMIVLYLGRALNRQQDDIEEKIIVLLFSGELERIYRTYLDITGQKTESDLLIRLFLWNKKNPRGITERNRLFQYVKIINERDSIGLPSEWSAKSVISLITIHEQFLKLGAGEDAEECKKALLQSVKSALSAPVIEPDLLVALASGFEELHESKYSNQILKKAFNLDNKVLSLLFNKRKGLSRFKLYTSLVKKYEKNLFSVSRDPWSLTKEDWILKFIHYYDEKKYQIALSISERVIELNKSLPDGWIMRAVCLIKLKRTNESGFCFSHKSVRVSESPFVIWLTGEYYEQMGDLITAEQKYLSVPMLCSIQPFPQLGLARIYYKQRKYYDSLEISDRIHTNHPTISTAIFLKAESLYAIGRIREALDYYTVLCTDTDKDPQTCIKAARCQLKLEDYDEADDIVTRILKEDDMNRDALRLKAYILLKKGRKTEADKYMDKILSFEPENGWVMKVRGSE